MLSKFLLRSSLSTHSMLTKAQRTNLTVTAALIKKLRDATGAPMIECKKALTAIIEENASITESECMVAANEYLRKRGSALAASKAGRSAKEGVVVFAVEKDKKRGSIIEVNCETDFVARNSTFMAFAVRSALAALEAKQLPTIVDPTGNAKTISIPELSNIILPVGPAAMNSPDAAPNSVSTELVDVITTCRENVRVRRAVSVELPSSVNGFVASYIHNELPVPEELEAYFASIAASGRSIGVGGAASLLAFETDAEPSQELLDLGRKVAMQTVAARPQYLARENVPESVIAKEKEIMLAASGAAGKDEKIINNLLAGKMNKFYEGAVLVDQPFLITNDTKKPKVSSLIADADKSAKITQLARLQRGEEVVGEEEPTQE